jgi:hypothetical protein
MAFRPTQSRQLIVSATSNETFHTNPKRQRGIDLRPRERFAVSARERNEIHLAQSPGPEDVEHINRQHRRPELRFCKPNTGFIQQRL